jgi:hypothetical protein
MTHLSSNHQQFASAVVQLGEQQDVVATQASFNTQGLKIIDKGAAIICWRLVPPQRFPTVLQVWLDKVDAAASRVSGMTAADGVSEDA